MNIILFGFKRCGKTHFGKLLAKKLKRPFVDTDHLIEEAHGEKCRQIALKIGDSAFRDLEKQAVASLEMQKESVISVGGGAILDPDNAKKLAKLGTLVYLQLDKETLKKRLLSGELPSYLDPKDPESSFEAMYQERKAIYEQIPALKIDIAGKNEQEIIDLIIEGLKSG
jgi:shikimate kinase